MLPWLVASSVLLGLTNCLTSVTVRAATFGASSSPRDCFSFGGSEPLSNTEISPSGCHSASCCQYVVVPGPSLKLECVPPMRQRTAPLLMSTSYSAHVLREDS